MLILAYIFTCLPIFLGYTLKFKFWNIKYLLFKWETAKRTGFLSNPYLICTVPLLCIRYYTCTYIVNHKFSVVERILHFVFFYHVFVYRRKSYLYVYFLCLMPTLYVCSGANHHWRDYSTAVTNDYRIFIVTEFLCFFCF